jgi:hypothetical protein
MKRIVFAALTMFYAINVFAQELSDESRITIRREFVSSWSYFRILKDPTVSIEKYRSRGGWIIPDIFPEKFYRSYMPQIKIYPVKTNWSSKIVNLDDRYFYVIEKDNGMTGVNVRTWDHSLKDTLRVSVNDSIFPYDNRFLVYYTPYTWDGKWIGKTYFCAGNVQWCAPKDIPVMKEVDMMGYIRGVQFDVRYVRYFNEVYSNSIKKYRPDYPDYEYTRAQRSLLSLGHLLIGAPKGKAGELIEFIYYTDNPKKTGDERGQYYEMRYILPSEIKSIKERRLEKRKLTEEEIKELIDSPLSYFIECPEDMWDFENDMPKAIPLR